MPKISVIVPVYCAEAYLNRCMDSLLQQTFDDYEIVVVDDGSLDRSALILDQYEQNYPFKVRVIHQQNQGVTVARQVALDHSDSQLIAFVDSDDYVDPTYFAKMTQRLMETKTKMCCANFAIHFNIPWLRRIPMCSRFRTRKPVDLVLQKEYLPILNVVHTGKLLPREGYDLGGAEFKANEDLGITYFNFAAIRHLCFENGTHYHYCPNPFGLVETNLKGIGYDTLLNTILPLETLRKQFQEAGNAQYYQAELTSIVIKKVAEHVHGIQASLISRSTKQELVRCMFDYLDWSVPEWQANPYYRTCFRQFEVPDIMNGREMKRLVKAVNHHSRGLQRDQILNRYAQVSSTK